MMSRAEAVKKMMDHPNGAFVAECFLLATEHGFADMHIMIQNSVVLEAQPGLKLKPRDERQGKV